MKIRNEKGLVIYGTNTSINNINTGNINTGERKEITFGQKANLSPGDYLISIGFTRYIDGNVDVIQRRHDVIKIWSRRSTILPQFVGLTFGVYNGKKHIPVSVSEEMIGQKFGEYSPTRTYYGHAADKKAKRK